MAEQIKTSEIETLRSQLAIVQKKNDHLAKIATSLAKAVSPIEMAEVIVVECQAALQADAICIFTPSGQEQYEMVAERGCTSEFKNAWKKIPRSILPVAENPNSQFAYFYGDSNAFKKNVPSAVELLKNANRHTICYAPLVVVNRVIGMLGYSYNSKPNLVLNEEFISVLISLCAQALERVQLFELESKARNEAQIANQAKTDFLANMSHEIRTPLGVVQGYSELLVESPGLTSQQRHWVSVIRRNAKQLMSIIGEVLDLAKIEAEKIDVEIIRCSLSEIIEDVQVAALYRARQKEIQINFFHENLPDWIHTDPTLFRQIFLNLVVNAIKFTEQGGVAVHLRMVGSDSIEVTIKDTGVGMTLEQQGRLFTPFIQGDTSTRRKYGGTGLGLFISKRLALALGGDVELVSSQIDTGSVFRFTLTCTSEVEQRGPRALRIAHDQNDFDLTGTTVLLVEDCIDNHELIQQILTARGAKLEMATSGQEGIDMALSNNYDVILMDIQMPKMDGHEAMARLRSLGYKKPIAAFTANALKSEKERSLREGFNDYITKPIDSRALILSIKNLSASVY
jgi:signal transduction histidine kinase